MNVVWYLVADKKLSYRRGRATVSVVEALKCSLGVTQGVIENGTS